MRFRTVLAGLAVLLAIRTAQAGTQSLETTVQPGVDDGQAAYDAGDPATALRIWTPLAAAGDARARFDLGLLYDLGTGVKQDATQAYLWYWLAARAGLPEAEFNVGVMSDSGRGVTQDVAEAALWYARAAAHGNRRAQFNLGQMYAAGDGVPRNPDQAAVWYADAAPDLPAAAAALARLQQAPGVAVRAVSPVLPVAPLDGMTLPPAPSVELVWDAPPQPAPVRYAVQLRRSRGATLLSTTLTESALLAPLPPGDATYAWRIIVLAPQTTLPGPWHHFTIHSDPNQ
jgi:hypothetical protein